MNAKKAYETYEIDGDYDLEEYPATATLTINGKSLDLGDGDNRSEITFGDLRSIGADVDEYHDDDRAVEFGDLPDEMQQEMLAELHEQETLERSAESDREAEKIMEHYKGARLAAVDPCQGFVNKWEMYPIKNRRDLQRARYCRHEIITIDRARELAEEYNDYAYGDAATKNYVNLAG